VLGAEIDQRIREIKWQGDGATLVKAAERMVARVHLLGEVVAAARTVARLDGDAQVEPRKVLDAALAVVRVDPGAGKEGDIDAERRKVAALAVDDAWRAKLSAALAELRRSVDALDSPASTTEVRSRSKPLRAELARAEDALARKRLDDSAAIVDALRPAFLAIAVDGLRARIEDVPPGTTKADWQPVVSAVTTQLDVASGEGDWPTRRDAYTAAQRAYFKGAIEALVAHALERAADNEKPASNPARLQQIAAELDAELAAGDAGIDRAARIYAARVAEVETAAQPRGGVMKVVAGHGTAAAPWIGIPDEVGERGGGAEPPEVRALDAKIRYTDWLVTLAVLGVALASGIKALWLPNLAWGVEGDALTALLWGAGVGAVGDAFAGLAGLRENLGSAA